MLNLGIMVRHPVTALDLVDSGHVKPIPHLSRWGIEQEVRSRFPHKNPRLTQEGYGEVNQMWHDQ